MTNYRRNADPHKRSFERAASAGDLGAAARWVRERQRAGELVPPAELISLGLASGLEKLPYDRRGNHVIHTLHKTFDRQTTVIVPGQVAGPTQYSSGVRAYNATVRGAEEPGRLQNWDLHVFPMLDPLVRQFVVNHTDVEGALVYLFSVGEGRHSLGYVVTRSDGQLMGRFSRDDKKSQSVIEAVTKVVSWQFRPEFRDLRPFSGKHARQLPLHAMAYRGRRNPPHRNPDESLRRLEREASTGDEEARRRLCYERIRRKPRKPFSSPWKGGLWVGSDPDRISGQDVSLWSWTPPDFGRHQLVWGTEGRLKIGPSEDTLSEIPMNPLYDRLLKTWFEPGAQCMEDVWRKPWPWDARHAFKVTEDSEVDEYWERVYAFEHDLQDVLDLSFCMDPKWWDQQGGGGHRCDSPDIATCNTCERSWCDRCDPTHGPLCHFCHGRGESDAEILDNPRHGGLPYVPWA